MALFVNSKALQLDIATIHQQLFGCKKALAGKFNDKLIDTTRVITEEWKHRNRDTWSMKMPPFQFCVHKSSSPFPRHPLGCWSSYRRWFHYDTDNEAGQISNEDLPRIEEEMKKIVKENFPSIREEATKDEARNLQNDPYKLELIEEHSEDQRGLTIYCQGEYVDLCWPTVPSTGCIQVFHLECCGAYWRGNSEMMQRILWYSLVRWKKILKALKTPWRSKERDHCKLGKELDLPMISQEVGRVPPFWLPWCDTVVSWNYIRQGSSSRLNTSTLHQLLQTSGHWDHCEDMFPTMDMGDGEAFVLRPRTVHHIEVYKHHVQLLPWIANPYRWNWYDAPGALTDFNVYVKCHLMMVIL